MPYPNLEAVPANIKKHKGAALTLAQANKWAEIFDALKERSNVDEPAAVAWTTWENLYELNDGKWVAKKRETEAAEGIFLLDEPCIIESVESAENGNPSRALVTLIKAGPCKTKKRYYDESALRELAESGMLANLKMYDSHPAGSEVVPGAAGKSRTVGDFLSFVKESWWDPASKSVKAWVQLCSRDLKEKLVTAAEMIGPSMNLLGWAYKGADGLEHVRKITHVRSADWVTDPNAGGAVELVESASVEEIQKERKEVNDDMNWKEIKMDELRKERPDLIEAVESEAKKSLKEAHEKEMTESKDLAEKNRKEADEAKGKLGDKEKELTESQGKLANADMRLKIPGLVDEKGPKANVLVKSEVIKHLNSQTFESEEKLVEAVENSLAEFGKKLPGKEKESGKKEGEEKSSLQDKTREFAESIGISQEEQERLAKVKR